jgi:hypothetical protein
MHRILCCCFLLITLPATIAGGYFIWHATAFIHAELIHQEQMAFGDSEQPIWIRLKSFTVWVPFAVFSIVVIWVNIRLLGTLIFGQSRNK